MGHETGQVYSVNQLVAESGVTPRTIRFADSQGLIVPRRAGNARVFTRRDRARLLLEQTLGELRGIERQA